MTTTPSHLVLVCGKYMSLAHELAELTESDTDAGLRVVIRKQLADYEAEILRELNASGDTVINWEGAAWAVYRSLDAQGVWRVNFTCMGAN